MSQQATSILSLSVKAAGVIAQYRGVDFTGAQVTVANAKIMGISERPASAANDYIAVTSYGTAICEAGAAIAVGAALAMDASGRVVTAASLAAAAPTITPALGTLAVAAGAVAVTSAVANGATSISGAPTATSSAPVLSGGDLPQFIVGHALQAAGAAGDFIEVLLSR